MTESSIKHRLFAQLAVVGQALANGNRIELLELLAQGERTVEALSRMTGLSVANASQHLQRLRRAGMVASRRDGLHVHYRLRDPAVIDLMGIIRRLAEANIAETERLVDRYLLARDEVRAVPAAEVLKMMRAGEVIVIDVRPRQEYAEGHVAGAVSVPIEELRARMDEIPVDREIVAYCRGPYCLLAYDAVAGLRDAGRRARRLEDGFPEWRRAGLPVEGTAVGSVSG